MFEACAITCFVLSTLMHIFWVKNKKTCDVFHRLDLSGINMMIFGSLFTIIYYEFYCDNYIFWGYIGVSALFSGLSLFATNSDFFLKSNLPWLNTLIYGVQISCGVLPIFTWYYLRYGHINHSITGDPTTLELEYNYFWIALEMGCYALGAIFFASHIPERFVQGKFTLFVNSHAIFHSLVVLGALAHLQGILNIMGSRLIKSTCQYRLF